MKRIASIAILLILTVVLMLKSTESASAAEGSQAIVRQGNAVILSCADGRKASIDALDNGVVRVWVKSNGDFSRVRSAALASSPYSDIPTSVSSDSSTVRILTKDLAVKIDPATLDLKIDSTSTKKPIFSGFNIEPKDAGWTMSYHLSSDEHLLGLGQDNRNGGRLDRRGTFRDIWSGQQINSGNVTASYSIPFLLSTGPDGHAYGLFCDNTYHMRYDLGATDPNTLKCDADGGEADFYFIDGPTLKDVIRRYTNLTGHASLPPLWALGYWQSKCVFWNWPDIDGATQQLSQKGFPLDVMVIDYDWPEKLNDYVWDQRWYSQGVTPDSKLSEYAKKGIKFVLSNSGPMVVKDSPTFASGWKAGVFATDGHGNPVEAGYYHGELLDFTSPAMTSWLLPQVAPVIQSGVAGWWLDLSEPEGDSAGTVYHGGTTADIHNQYALLESSWFERAQLSVHPNQRPFILTRAGSAGIQRFHTAVWSGDTHSDYATLGAHPPEMLNSGLSGLSLWTSDSGGFLSGFYKNDQYGAHAKLYERWFQFATFCPILRTHHAGPVLPYEFGPATEAGCLHYDQLRYSLLPYIYTYAHAASVDGLPITRPLLLEYPNDAGSVAAKGDEYLFGSELLVAPVLQEDVTSRPIYFPPGKWIDWDTAKVFDGGRTVQVDAPQHRIPVEVRAGAIIPTAPPMRNTAQGAWDPLTLEVFPSGQSHFTLYSDDGNTFDYQKGADTLTDFESSENNGALTFAINESNRQFVPKTYIARFHLDRRPAHVIIDGANAKQSTSVAILGSGQWVWDAVGRILTVKVANKTELKHVIAVKLMS